MLLDAYMPAFHVSRRHAIKIRAPAATVYETARHLEFGRSRLIRLLFWMRGIPRGLTMDRIADRGMTMLAERPGREFVLGVVGRFWRMKPALEAVSAEEFRKYQPQGCAKAVWGFQIEEQTDGADRHVVLATETRVYCPDDVSRRLFSLYWLFVGPFSSMIRLGILRMVRREAEVFTLRSPPTAPEA